MTQYPGAKWRGPIPNKSTGRTSHHGLVLHIMQGTLDGTDAWFHNPAAKASADFGVGKDGRVYQWVDTDEKAWAQAAGNPAWNSVECEGHSGDSLTDAQVRAIAGIFAWGHAVYGWPLVATDDPNGSGLGWHGMGGAAWGGHLACPGEPIRNARSNIIALAGGYPPGDNDMTSDEFFAATKWPRNIDGSPYSITELLDERIKVALDPAVTNIDQHFSRIPGYLPPK